MYEPTRRYALRRALPDEAEDAVSETMLLLWQQPERIPKGSEVGWSIGVCRKVLANMRRKRVRRESLLGRFVTQLLPAAPAPVISREPEITAALRALPERDREALLLAVW
ncbi:sigma-70 family RNA polymerase sigma factor, partial [bacterium]|nr:sigma-70 family RNA polymerase sigma factor [bacterium]